MLSNLLKPAVDQETLFALKYRLPDKLEVSINKEPNGGYSARIFNTHGNNIVTEGKTGPELFEMVNDAILTALDIPEQYRIYMTSFFPPEDVRTELDIPDKYLEKKISLVKA